MAPIEYGPSDTTIRAHVYPGRTERITLSGDKNVQGKITRQEIKMSCDQDDEGSTVTMYAVQGRPRFTLGPISIGFIPEGIDEDTKETGRLKKGESGKIGLGEQAILEFKHI